MSKKCAINIILRGVAIILLLAAAFDVLPWSDNQVIFAGVVLFVISGIIAKLGKGKAGCCK